MKNRALLLYCSIQRRMADCASTVKCSAFSNTIDLKFTPVFHCVLVLAKNFNSSRINLIPLPWAQLTNITFECKEVSFSYIFFKKFINICFLPEAAGP